MLFSFTRTGMRSNNKKIVLFYIDQFTIKRLVRWVGLVDPKVRQKPLFF